MKTTLALRRVRDGKGKTIGRLRVEVELLDGVELDEDEALEVAEMLKLHDAWTVARCYAELGDGALVFRREP